MHLQEKVLISVPAEFSELSTQVVVLLEQLLHLPCLITPQHPH